MKTFATALLMISIVLIAIGLFSIFTARFGNSEYARAIPMLVAGGFMLQLGLIILILDEFYERLVRIEKATERGSKDVIEAIVSPDVVKRRLEAGSRPSGQYS